MPPHTHPRLFPAPLQRPTFISLAPRPGGYIRLAVLCSDDPHDSSWDTYYDLTTSEALDVIEAVLGDEWGF